MPRMRRGSIRDASICQFIDDYWAANGYGPSIQDIADGLGFNGKSSVFWRLRRLARRNRITSTPGVGRTWKTVGP